MFCLFSPSKCANILQLCGDDKEDGGDAKDVEEMHSSESVQPAAGPTLLLQLGRLIIRARSSSPSPLTKLKHPSTSQQVHIQTQPKVDEEDSRLEANLSSHVEALWTDQIPVCVEILLGPSCSECFATMTRSEPAALRGLLLERWTMTAVLDKSESPSVISSPWLLNAIRSQLHFSQLSAWRARLQPRHERRRKLSHEKCNYKKIESNLNESKMNIIYSIKTPGEKTTDFARPPTDHTFPLTDIGNNKYLKVVLESLPRIDDIPEVKCACRRSSKDFSAEDLVGRLSDLSIGSRKYDGAINSNIGTPSRRLSIITNPESTEYLFTVKDKLVDDRMHTPCNENGKHKCNCDDESDDKVKNQPKKLDERRIKEIAKYKRRIRKEKRICDSTSSEGDVKVKETTSIPILQASRFDRFRAIGCYRNQTYLTLPASRIETKSPFIDTEVISPPVFKKTNTVATQTDFACPCGNIIDVTKCESCVRGMVRSDGNYNLASLSENGARRKLDDDGEKSIKKLKCDNNVSSLDIIKRPKLKRLFPIIDKLDMIVTDRNHINEKDMKDLHLMTDDSVFSTPKGEVKNDGPKHQTESNHLTDEPIKTHHTNGSYLDHTSNGPMSHEDGSLNHADEVNLQLKSDRCLNQERYSHRIDGPNCLHQMTNGSGLNPRTDGSSHPITNGSNLHPRTTGSSLHPTTDEPSLHPTTDGPSLHPKTDGSDLNTSIDGYSLHPQADGSNGLNPTDNHYSKPKESKRQKTYSISDDDYVLYEKCDYGTIDTHDREIDSPIEEQPDFKFSIPERSEQQHPDQIESLQDEFIFPDPKRSEQVPSSSEMDRFRWRFDSAASMVFHTKTGLPLTSSPAPLRRGNNCFDFDDSINGISGIKSALFHPMPLSPAPPASPASPPPAPRRGGKPRMGSSTGLLGSFEESALQGRLEAVATVHGFTAELGASGAFCPPHKRLPVTVFFYAPGGTAAPYMGHINLGPGGYRVSRSGTVQVSLFNPHGTLVKMFVVLYDLSRMPRAATTFLRQRTLSVPASSQPGREPRAARCLRYLIHLRFMTSKTGKLYLHTDIRLIVSRKADLDTAAAHSALLRPPASPPDSPDPPEGEKARAPNRVFGGSSEHDSESPEIGYDNVSYELRSFTYAPDNPKYSPR